MEEYLKGNELYQTGNYTDAVLLYTASLKQCSQDLAIKVRLNLAQCFIRCERFAEAVSECTAALKAINKADRETNQQWLVKGLLRRALSQEKLGHYEKALVDIEEVLGMPLPPSTVKDVIASRTRINAFIKCDREVSHAEGKPVMMMTEQQALRLNFLQEPPCVLTLGQSSPVRVCVTNELGLWNRALLREKGIVRPSLKCELVWEGSSTYRDILKHKFYVALTSSDDGAIDGLQLGVDGKVDVQVTVNCSDEVLHSDIADTLVMLRFSLDFPLGTSGEVLPLLSLPTRVQIPSHQTRGKACDADAFFALSAGIHATCVRELALSSGLPAAEGASTQCVYALESPGYLGIAGKVWDSMYVLLQYLAQHVERLVRGKRILELGCGTGLAGISLCSMDPAQVTLTDMAQVVLLIRANLALNSLMVSDEHLRAVLRNRYTAAAYCWGGSLQLPDEEASPHTTETADTAAEEQPPRPAPYFDVILASDVVYYPEGYEPLLTTLVDLLTVHAPHTAVDGGLSIPPGITPPVCILAHRHRHPEDKKFFDALFACPRLQVTRLAFEPHHTAGDLRENGASSGVEALRDVILFEISAKETA